MKDNTPKTKKKVDDRLLYLIPSIVAICMSLTTLLFFFGYKIVDINNTCYHIYVSPPVQDGESMSDDEVMSRLDEILERRKVNGFTIMKNLQGGIRTDNGKMKYENSYQVILMNISKGDMESIANEIAAEFAQDLIVVDESVSKSYYLTPEGEKVDNLFDYFDSIVKD